MKYENTLVFSVAIFACSAHAQIQGACAPLLAYGIHDTSNVIQIDSALSRVTKIVCSQEFSTYQNAEAAGKNFNLNILDYVSVGYVDQTNSNNYQQRRSKFCSYNDGDVSSNSSLSSNIRTINGDLVSAFNSCIDKVTGFYAFAEPSSDLKKFTIHVRKQGIAQITSFSTSPKVRKCTGGLLAASTANPVVVNGSAQFICERVASDSPISIIGNTAGDGTLFQKTIELPGTGATLSSLIERVKALEYSKTPSNQVGYFNAASCPLGWRSIPKYWEGRYVVATVDGNQPGQAVGVALSHAENRPVGAHMHTTTTAFRGGTSSDRGAMWGNVKDINRSDGTTIKTFEDDAMTIPAKSGTNAPYITLMACIKN